MQPIEKMSAGKPHPMPIGAIESVCVFYVELKLTTKDFWCCISIRSDYASADFCYLSRVVQVEDLDLDVS